MHCLHSDWTIWLLQYIDVAKSCIVALHPILPQFMVSLFGLLGNIVYICPHAPFRHSRGTRFGFKLKIGLLACPAGSFLEMPDLRRGIVMQGFKSPFKFASCNAGVAVWLGKRPSSTPRKSAHMRSPGGRGFGGKDAMESMAWHLETKPKEQKQHQFGPCFQLHDAPCGLKLPGSTDVVTLQTY